MELRAVYSKCKGNLISNAIMWFTRKREHPERDCSHLALKFQGCGGILEDDWMCFEAMERGVWLNFWNNVIGKDTVIVAEFRLELPDSLAFDVARKMVLEFCGQQYDYAGIGIWAGWILASKWFGSIIKWLNVKFRPKKVRARFCSGLVLSAIEKIQEMDTRIDWGFKGMMPRTSSPRLMIDVMFDKTALYTLISGTTRT
jgi:hypothetical protein